MKVYIDRNHCDIYQAGCESCFGGRVEFFFGGREFGLDMDVGGCVMEIEEEDERDQLSFYIKDRDGEDKELHIDRENWPEAYDSWMQLYEKQQAGSND
ncbi:hypothetical protein ACFLYP_02840 [Chloroflexota bacterium]